MSNIAEANVAEAELAKRLLARRSLLYFTKYTHFNYRDNWHHKFIAEKLLAFIHGEIKRLIIMAPPQTGKSELSTRRAPAFGLGLYPNHKWAIAAYNHSLASKFNREIQRIITSAEYRKLFPETKLNEKNIVTDATGSWLRNSHEFEIVGERGSLVSVGVKGGLTGQKVDRMVIDDPFKGPEDAFSEKSQLAVIDWFDSVASTRVNNEGCIAIVNTSWHTGDLTQRIKRRIEKGLEPYDWEIIRIQSIHTGESDAEIDPRSLGDPLWPKEHSLERLESIRNKNPRIFNALHQQEPLDISGGVFELAWIDSNRVDVAPPLVEIVIAVDPAVTAHDGSDETGIIVAGKNASGEMYVLQDASGRYTPAGWARIVADLYESWEANRVVVEVNQGGDLVKENIHRVEKRIPIFQVRASKGKVTRAEPVATDYEAGKVHHVGYFSKLEKQLVGWVPGKTSPDRLDACVYALSYLGGKKKRTVRGIRQ